MSFNFFSELSKILLPYIDQFKSIYTVDKLTSLIKSCRSNPSWGVNKVAESLLLPELKEDYSIQEPNEEEVIILYEVLYGYQWIIVFCFQ